MRVDLDHYAGALMSNPSGIKMDFGELPQSAVWLLHHHNFGFLPQRRQQQEEADITPDFFTWRSQPSRGGRIWGGHLTILLSDLPCHCTFNTWKVLFLSDLGLFDPVRPALTPVSSVIHFMLPSDFAIPMIGKLDDVDSDVSAGWF